MIFEKENILNRKILCKNEKHLMKLFHILKKNNIIDVLCENYNQLYNSLYIDNSMSYKLNNPIWLIITGIDIDESYMKVNGYHFYYRTNNSYKELYKHDKIEYIDLSYSDIINYERIKKLGRIIN